MLLAALLALLSVPQARALWLGRLNPNQVTVLLGVPAPALGLIGPRPGPTRGATQPLGSPQDQPRLMWASGVCADLCKGTLGSQVKGCLQGLERLLPSHLPSSIQLLGSWYVLAKASGEKDFAVEKATKNIEGVVVTLTPENNLKMLSSRHR